MAGTLRNILVACLLGWVSVCPAGQSQDATAEDFKARTLVLIHDGRFDEADALLDGHRPGPGQRSAHAFFRAFVTYWRLLYDDDNDGLREVFEDQLNRAIDEAKDDLEGDGPEHEAALWKGSAHLLYGQLKAAQRKAFSAAFEAKRSYKMLRRAVKASPDEEADADFGLGTYQYYVDQLPTIVKGLRFLLFIPGGDRDEGLERLHRAARESRYFSLEARLVLATIYASDHEQLYDEAFEVADEAVAASPDTIAVLHGAARLDLELFRPYRALRRLDRALVLASRHPGTATSVLAALRLHAARSEFILFRPDLALDRVRPLLTAPDRQPADSLARARRLAAECALLLPEPRDWYLLVDRDEPQAVVADPVERRRSREAAASLSAARPALDSFRAGDVDDALIAARDLVREGPDDPVNRLVAGRLLLAAGQASEARPLLESAVADPELPGLLRRQGRLLAGQAADAAGKREDALDWYRRTADGPSFPGRDAALLYQHRPFRINAAR